MSPASGSDDAFSEAELLRVTLSSIGDGVITTDAHGKVTFLNPVAQALTGWTQAQAVGRSLTEVFRIVNQDSRAEVENPALRCLREGVVVGLANHTILIAQGGAERNIDDSAAPIRSDKGEVAGAVLVFRDITERYRQESLVKAALDYAVNITNTMRNPFLVLGPDLRVASANRAFYARFRVKPEETEGRLIYELGDGQWDVPALRTQLEEVLPQNRFFEDYEVEQDFPGIGRRVVALNARRVNKPGNHSQLILLVIEDITERRQAERRLRESETRYRRLFDSAKDGILILDAATGRITHANPYFADLLGAAPGDLTGKELWEIGLFKDIHESKGMFERLQRDGEVRYDHLPLKNAGGETIPVEFTCNVYHEDDRLVAQCNVRSIADRQLREQARHLADESRRKDEFLAMLSHELRNPLAPIRAAVHLLRTQERGGENTLQTQANAIIERQVANLTKLISDLLEVSRVLSGRITIDLERHDLRILVRHALETVQPLIDQRSHRLDLTLPDQEVWVNADATRMEEVIINLLTNAAKYTDDDGLGRLTVTLGTERRGGRGAAVLRVKDNGDGLDGDLIPRLFDLFTQGTRSLDRSQGGLGIGLALAKRLVELQDGSIAAKSDGPRKGSEFTVRMPLAMPPDASAETADAAPGAPAGLGEGARILLVDDNLDLVMMLASLLRQKGYSVQAAYTGPEGLTTALQWRPDIVFMDIGLPGLDGYQVARRLRGDPRLAGSPMRLIAMTGYGREVDKQHAREAGFDGHLTKPVDFQDMEKMIAAPAGR